MVRAQARFLGPRIRLAQGARLRKHGEGVSRPNSRPLGTAQHLNNGTTAPICLGRWSTLIGDSGRLAFIACAPAGTYRLYC